MSIIKLSAREVEAAKSSIELRKSKWEGSPDYLNRLDEVLKRLDFPIIDLTPSQRPLLIGCIRDFSIKPNEDLFRLTDFEILISVNSIKEKLESVDIGLSAINKLKTKKDKKSRRFEDAIWKVEQIIQAQEVFYSNSESGGIYKVGIAVDGNKCLRIEHVFNDYFEFDKLTKSSYSNSGTPEKVLEIIEDYGQENALSDYHERIAVTLRTAIKIHRYG